MPNHGDPTPYQRQLLADAPPLTDYQRTALAELLKPVQYSPADVSGGRDR